MSRAARSSLALLVVLAAGGAALAGCAPEPAASLSPAVSPCAPGAVDVPPGAENLQSALDAAAPGAVLQLSPVTYSGRFRISTSGQADRPIVLCGVAGTVLDAGGAEDGYALHLDGASYWQVHDLTVRGGQKGVVLDASSHTELARLRISDVGQEGLHLRAASSDNHVEDTVVERTGLTDAKYGEGVYVGSAEANWCRYTSCEPDRSDRNVFERLEVRDTTAEALDVKEGTTGGIVRGSVLAVGPDAVVDSAVDLKGSGWSIEGSTVTGPVDAVSVHVIVSPWGSDNTVATSTLQPGAGGVGVHLVGDARSAGNVVSCDNSVPGGASAGNIPCR
ncbi:hypothetical protein MTES_0876 [Microbacterium testaceum StLB037]|uniref:Right handed beta helix domain-containing protein n=1 Tax=Microbacterium testaceum (strain StLB037) TaxID=979556 RepID=E8NEH4_MICTS|nr:hypothetical protein [Microbacterium testaceum]BAJ73840.1 hypothetical protein MTES_0876 [Microbacterium testaceum StLB037]